jgi:hypothetical protein
MTDEAARVVRRCTLGSSQRTHCAVRDPNVGGRESHVCKVEISSKRISRSCRCPLPPDVRDAPKGSSIMYELPGPGWRRLPASSKRDVLLETKHNIIIDIYIHINTHLHKYTYVYSISMSTSERLTRLNLKIHKVGHQ